MMCAAAIDRAAINRNTNSDRVRERLENRLQPPDQLAIEQSDRRITMASSTAPQVTFDADGRARSETNANGRTIQTTASLSGSTLTIRTQGDRASDFQVTFRPVDNGRSLQVTRRFFSDRINQPIRNPEFLYTYLGCSTVGRIFEPIPKYNFGQSQGQPASWQSFRYSCRHDTNRHSE